jgi:hypothetical protein
MTFEVKMRVDALGIRWKGDRTASGKQAPVPQKGMTTTEKVSIRRVHVDERLRWVPAIESASVIPLAHLIGCAIVIVSAKEDDLTVSIYRRHECRVDGYNIVGRNRRTPRHGNLLLLRNGLDGLEFA